jgi:hypothetical protein
MPLKRPGFLHSSARFHKRRGLTREEQPLTIKGGADMKKLAMILTLILAVFFTSVAFAQTQWPNPCDQSVTDAEYSTFQFPNDGVLRFPCLIAYMGYFDETGQWKWWTTETYPECLYQPDGLPWNMFGDPTSGMGTAFLPMMAYGDPSGQPHHRYYYYWPASGYDYSPVITYAFDTAMNSSWGWYVRKSTYENGRSSWQLNFTLSKTVLQPQCWWEPNIANLNGPPNGPPGPGADLPDVPWEDNTAWGIVCNFQGTPPNQYVLKRPVAQLGQAITWEDIDSVKIMKKSDNTYAEIQGVYFTEPFDNYFDIVGANFDPQRSWLYTTCPTGVPPFSCHTFYHETTATITGFEPQTGQTYALLVTLKDGTQIQSPDWIVPITVELEPIPWYTKKTITLKKRKITIPGSVVRAISFTELEDGSLLVQYQEPFIETEPPALQTNPYLPNAWRGTHIRFGLANKPPDQTHDSDDPAILLWPNIPSNVGTVIFPKEFINRLKNSPGFTGKAFLNIEHRDQFNIKRWFTGDGSLTYRFKNRFPVE